MNRYKFNFSLDFDVYAENEERAFELAGEAFHSIVEQSGYNFEIIDVEFDEDCIEKSIKEEENKIVDFKNDLLLCFKSYEYKINKLNNYYILEQFYEHIENYYPNLYELKISEEVKVDILILALLEKIVKYNELDVTRDELKSLLNINYDNDKLDEIINKM